MGLPTLEKRVRELERISCMGAGECKCRAGENTRYHNAEELEHIMEITCPVHGVRDLGEA
jgi:hypothetical protein